MTAAAKIVAAIPVAGNLTVSGNSVVEMKEFYFQFTRTPVLAGPWGLATKIGTGSAYGNCVKNFYAFETKRLDVRREISWH